MNYQIFSKGKQGQACVFTMGSQLWKAMRWIKGDRVDVLFDAATAEGQIVRCKEGGWALTDWAGESSPVRLRITYRKEMGLPVVDERVDLAVELTDNTIAFAFPIKFRQPIAVPKQ